jgi:hypothetical protein
MSDEIPEVSLNFYLVYFPAKKEFARKMPYTTADINRAKVWRKPGPAKSCRTQLLDNHPELGPCVVLQYTGGNPVVVPHKYSPKYEREMKELAPRLASCKQTIAQLEKDLQNVSSPQARVSIQASIREAKSRLDYYEEEHARIMKRANLGKIC